MNKSIIYVYILYNNNNNTNNINIRYTHILIKKMSFFNFSLKKSNSISKIIKKTIYSIENDKKSLSSLRKQHIIRILDEYDESHMKFGSNFSLDLFLKKYFISHKSICLEDRSFIYDQVYNLIRNRILLEVIASKRNKSSWINRFDAYYNYSYFYEQKKNMNIPLYIRESFPKELYDLLYVNHKENIENLLSTLNKRAPITIRANILKTDRFELKSLLKKEGFHVELTKYSPFGLTFLNKPELNFFSLDIFKQGYFEIQDEGSQLASLRVKCKPGDIVLDYCGGSGGKTLAFAPFMQNKGQIYIHDIRKHILLEAKRRLRRGKIQNFQIQPDKTQLLTQISNKCDWILLDVPCSGTGTLRRNPEYKYKFNIEKFNEIREVQQDILEESLLFLKPNGKIVYTTCSILHEENLSQITKFCEKHRFSIEDDAVFETFPKENGMDGFFSATLVRNN